MSRADGRGSAGIWIGIGAAAVIVVAAAWISGFDFSGETGKNLRVLSDAFLAAGAVMAGIWALSKVASTGFFDLFSYSFGTLRDRLVPSRRMDKPEEFYDYKTRIAEKRKPRGNTTLFIGLVCIALSVLFLVLFKNGSGAKAEEAQRPRVLVALGDSYTAGEGIEPYYGQDAPMEEKCRNPDWLAHRSEKAWPGLLTLPGVDGVMADHRGVNYFFAAASGAKTQQLFLLTEEEKEAGMNAGLEKPYNRDGISGVAMLAPQLEIFDEVKGKGLEADYVVLTIGGNDLDFESVISMGMFGQTAFLPGETNVDKGVALLEQQYETAGVRELLKRAFRDIAACAGPQAVILAVGYPDPFIDETADTVFSKTAAKIINEANYFFTIELINLVDECRSEGMNICYVGVNDAFGGHGAYGADPYINPIKLLAGEQDLNSGAIVSSSSMHPNAKGAEAYAMCVQYAIDRLEAGTDIYIFDYSRE